MKYAFYKQLIHSSAYQAVRNHVFSSRIIMPEPTYSSVFTNPSPASIETVRVSRCGREYVGKDSTVRSLSEWNVLT